MPRLHATPIRALACLLDQFREIASVLKHSRTVTKNVLLTSLPRLETIAAIESMSNNKISAQMRPLKIGAQAVGALAVGALAMGALAIGTLAIGRLVIGRSRIRRLEIDELVVARLHVTESLTVPSTPAVENDRAKKQESERFDQRTTLDRAKQ
jgi:hypothetical protein